MITVNAATLREALGNVAPHTAKGDTVPVLDAVRFESDGTTLTVIATDRYTLATQTLPTIADTDSQPFTTLLDGDDVKRIVAALKDIPRGVNEWPVQISEDDWAVTVTVVYAGTSLRCVPVAGEFPKWASIMDGAAQAATDTANTTPHQAYNPQLIAKFAKVKVDGRATMAMRMFFVAPNKPAYVEIGETFRAVLMPVRVEWPAESTVHAAAA